jgi:hypothetical protein
MTRTTVESISLAAVTRPIGRLSLRRLRLALVPDGRAGAA